MINMTIKILITGGCGFIGSHFINLIFSTHREYHIINIDALTYCANEKNVHDDVRQSSRYTFIKGNILDSDLLEYILKQNEITFVVHFAAQSHVQRSFDNSIEFTYDNVLGTHKLLEACKLHARSLQKFIHVSTDEVYGQSMIDIDEQQKHEHSVLCPTNPYAATKAAAELIATSYFHSFGLPIIITRGNNVYGMHQYPEKVIPRFIHRLLNDQTVEIQGDGSVQRSFMHVSDAARAYHCVMERGVVGEVYNIGCDEGMEYSVLQIAHYLIQRIKKTTDYDRWISYIPDRPFNDARYYISNDKLKSLGWTIQTIFKDGIEELIRDMSRVT